MFVAFFAFALVTVHAAEKLPSYIHPCDLKDPNYNQCIAKTIDRLKDRICTGMPEVNVSPTEPIIVDKIVIYDTGKLKLYMRDLKISGYCDMIVNSVHVSSDKLHMDIDLTFNQLNVDSIYDFEINLLVPLAHKGPVHISVDNLAAKIKLDTKMITKDGKKEKYASKANTNLDIKTFKYKFGDSEKNLVQLHKILSNIINKNEQDIISKVKPVAEETISKLVVSVFNNVTLSRYEQLFPENV